MVASRHIEQLVHNKLTKSLASGDVCASVPFICLNFLTLYYQSVSVWQCFIRNLRSEALLNGMSVSLSAAMIE